ncbi:PREDICTED: U3 small nucleolar RNA-interacting protein 2 isoform X2 [Dinoponera quadriceps]|nr:PREDICTED: U3 small nucleolar RNA-interacting protein 2 isoform X2 [Dinoponera quadriceps]
MSKQSKKIAKKSIPDDDESIASTDEEFAEKNLKDKAKRFESESEEEEETAQEKRIRLAKKYIEAIERKEKDREEYEEGAVSRRLREEYLEEKGRLRKTIAANYVGHKDLISLKCKQHKLPITCICLSTDGSVLYSGAKDGSIVKWSLKTNTKLIALKGRKGKTEVTLSCYVQCLAISTDGKFLVVGDKRCNDIKILCGDTLKHIKNLQGHRGSVSGLVFRKNTHTLYSASTDRSVKVWNLDEMAYVETFFGHQTGITSIDALSRERAITSGGFDSSIRIWKIVEESQLIFHGHNDNPIDEVKLINDENFFSCSNDGQLCVWSSLKKKPLCLVTEAHGKDKTNNQPLWISSIAALLNTDLVASGSQNGSIKLWQCGEGFKSLNLLFEVEVPGFINALAFTPDGNHLIAGIGKEHKNGSWWRIASAKNCIVVIPLIHNEKYK